MVGVRQMVCLGFGSEGEVMAQVNVGELLERAFPSVAGSEGKVLVVGGRNTNFTYYEELKATGRVIFWLEDEARRKDILPPGTRVLVLTHWREPTFKRKFQPQCEAADAVVVDVGSSTGVFNKWSARLLEAWNAAVPERQPAPEEPEGDEELISSVEPKVPQDFKELVNSLHAFRGMLDETLCGIPASIHAFEEKLRAELRPQVRAELRTEVEKDFALRVTTEVERRRAEILASVTKDARTQIGAAERRTLEVEDLNKALAGAVGERDSTIKDLEARLAAKDEQIKAKDTQIAEYKVAQEALGRFLSVGKTPPGQQ